AAFLPHHEHRAAGVAHHVPRIRAEEIGAYRVPLRPLRRHDDEVRADRGRLFQNLLIDAALAHRGRDPMCRQAALHHERRKRILRGLSLLHLEIGGTYSASMTGVSGSTFTNRTVPSICPIVITAAESAGLVRSGSARSTRTKIFLYIFVPCG